jgi:hypothetical protein
MKLIHILLISIVTVALITQSSSREIAHAEVNAITMAEGNDFATQVLRDPWDMSQFSDVSQGLNQPGYQLVTNISDQNGVFQATSTSITHPDAQFFLLWPGFQQDMFIGKVGHNYPIPSSQYHCLYLAMQVNSPTSDFFQAFWFADEMQNQGSSPWGFATYTLHPGIWYLYKADLLANSDSDGGTRWGSLGSWQGLRIDPTNLGNVTFFVDWARLTDCQPSTLPPISLPAGSNTIGVSLNPLGTSRAITLDPSSYNVSQTGNQVVIDVEGLQAGTYNYNITRSGSTIASGSFNVNQAPIINFDKPSYTSGVDYATQAGNPWDMSGSNDATGLHDMTATFSDGLLNMNTASGKDPQVQLWKAGSITPSNGFRYLSFRMYTQGAYQDVGKGMIVRWIWGTPNGASECYLVSQDIPFDVGWQTYSIDLYDSFNGLAEQTLNCSPSNPTIWKDAPLINYFRWDPNENITGTTMFQQLDWIRLTQMDQIKIGQPFTLRIYTNKSMSGVDLSFYYTTDPSNPKAHVLSIIPPDGGQPSGKYKVYLPVIMNAVDTTVTPGQEYLWDTSHVNPGTYYICVEANDGYNTGIYCSDAPVNVTQ